MGLEELSSPASAKEDAREVAYLVRHSVRAQYLLKDAEATFLGLLLQDRIQLVAMEPLESYDRMLLHRVADLFSPGMLVTDFLLEEDEVVTPVRAIMNRETAEETDADPQTSSQSPSLTLSERKATYEAARARIFSDKRDSTPPWAVSEWTPSTAASDRPRADPVVARRMIAHALNMPALRVSPTGGSVRQSIQTSPEVTSSSISPDSPESTIGYPTGGMPPEEVEASVVSEEARRESLNGAKRAARRLLASALGMKPFPKSEEPAMLRSANGNGRGTSGWSEEGGGDVEGVACRVENLSDGVGGWKWCDEGEAEVKESERTGGAKEAEEIVVLVTPTRKRLDKGGGITVQDDGSQKTSHESEQVGEFTKVRVTTPRRKGRTIEDTHRDCCSSAKVGDGVDKGGVLLISEQSPEIKIHAVNSATPINDIPQRRNRGGKLEKLLEKQIQKQEVVVVVSAGSETGGLGKKEEDKKQRRSLAIGPARQILAHALGQSSRRS